MPLGQYQKYFIIVIPVLLIGLLIYFFSDIFSYFALGWIISLLGRPLFKLFNRFINKQLSAVVTLLLIIITFSIFMWILIPSIVQQTRNLTNIDFEDVKNNLDEPLHDWNDWLIKKGLLNESSENPSQEKEYSNSEDSGYDIIKIDTSHGASINIFVDLNNNFEKEGKESSFTFENTDSFVESMKEKVFTFFNPSQIPKIFGGIAGFFGNLLITVLSSFFIAFFFLKESGLFTRMIKTLTPDEKENQAEHAISESENLLARYFIGIATQMTIITILVSIILRIFGFQNALLIAFMAGLLNVIPYIGPFLGAMFGIVITLSSNMDASFYGELLPSILTLIGIFGVMQLLDNFILQPNIFSKSVKAHPLEIFVVILVGAKLGGVLGMILAIPAYTIIRVIAKVFLSEFKIVQNITRGL